MPLKSRLVRGLGRPVTFVPREQLRAERNVLRFRFRGKLPPTPATWNWADPTTTEYPLLGNGSYGHCFLASACHHVGTWTDAVGDEYLFDEATVIKEYLRLSGGDNGLSDQTLFRYWTQGIINNAHRILDWLVIPPTDTLMSPMGYLYGGLQFTLGVPDVWIDHAAPGGIWDAGPGVYSDNANGHAVHLSARKVAGYDLQTWGFRPPICLTPAGVKVCDPEAIAVFSLDWFDQWGYAPNRMHYTTLAPLWHECGGKILPPSHFPPPTPQPPPPPPVPPLPIPAQIISVDLAGKVVHVPSDWNVEQEPLQTIRNRM